MLHGDFSGDQGEPYFHPVEPFFNQISTGLLPCRVLRADSSSHVWAVATPGLISAPWTATLQYRPHKHACENDTQTTHRSVTMEDANTSHAALKSGLIVRCAAVFYEMFLCCHSGCLNTSTASQRYKPLSICTSPICPHHIKSTHTVSFPPQMYGLVNK